MAAVIAALNAGATPEQIVNDPAVASDPSKIISKEEGDVTPADGTGTPVAPPMNARIEEMMANGATYEEAVANQNAAIRAGADANDDGMVTNAEWTAHTSGDANSTETITGGTNTSVGDNSSDSTVVSGGGDAVVAGTGDDGNGDSVVKGDDTGGVVSDDNGPGSVVGVTTDGPGVTGTDGGPGPRFGVAPGSGGGFGDGFGFDGGMMSGGGSDYTPSWGELFAYTTIDLPTRQKLEPIKEQIIQARGMLS